MTENLPDELKNRSLAEPFAKLLGMEAMEVAQGRAVVKMEARPEHLNLLGALHGGALFSLIDEAFQLACNAYGVLAVALNVSINYMAAAKPGSVLIAKAQEVHMTKRTTTYACEVREAGSDKLIATAQALAYRTGKEIDFST